MMTIPVIMRFMVDAFAFILLLFVFVLVNQPVQNDRGVTYSRPIIGTGVPSRERFRTHPIWALCKSIEPARQFVNIFGRSGKGEASRDHINDKGLR
jgi:hypothetical protein